MFRKVAKSVDKTDNLKYGMYLTGLISSVLNSTSPKEPFAELDWDELYKLAAFHNVAVIIYPAVKQLDVPEEVMRKFEKNRNVNIAREARFEIERARVFSALSANGINFVKLKGVVLKDLYPMAYMRTYIDVDLFVSPEDRIKAKDIMLGLGYELEGSIDYHDEYNKDDFFLFEFHSPLVSPKSQFYSLFEDVFSKSVEVNKGEFEFKSEYCYLYILFHIYKHFRVNGCGIRGFVDLYLFRKAHPDMDNSLIDRILDEQGLTEYYARVCRIIAIFFENEMSDENFDEIAGFIFKSGEYGRSELIKTTYFSSNKTIYVSPSDRLKFLMECYFPGIDVMKNRYPVLEKAPVLLPICWIRRGFYTIFHKREALKEHKETVRSIDSYEIKEAKHVHELIGIK